MGTHSPGPCRAAPWFAHSKTASNAALEEVINLYNEGGDAAPVNDGSVAPLTAG